MANLVVSDIKSALASASHAKRDGRLIGEILTDAGRLKREDIERILRLQGEKGLRFGDAAIQLRLVTPEDIAYALSCQFDYPYVAPGESAFHQQLVAAGAPFGAQAEALRAVRAQLLLRGFDGDAACKTLAVVSAERGEGRSFIAANLAVLFSQLNKRTLLIDADLRHPVQHRLFNLGGSTGLSEILSGRGGPETIHPVASLQYLAVLPAGLAPPNPSDLLARPHFAPLLQDLVARFDVVIVDTPAAVESPDAQIIAARAGAAMIVARRNASRLSQVHDIAHRLAEAKAAVVGTVLNDA